MQSAQMEAGGMDISEREVRIRSSYISMAAVSGAHYRIAREYARLARCRVVFPDYRLAPEYPFPVPVEDCYQAYAWTVRNAEKLGIDSSRIVIAGDSTGGNLAAAVTIMASERGERLPAGSMLIYPVTDRRMESESMKMYTDTPVWNSRLTEMMWKAYLGSSSVTDISHASVMEAVRLDFFPETYAEVSEFDCLHDEGAGFRRRLRREGVAVELHEEKECCHGYEMALRGSIMRNAMERRIRYLTRIFSLSSQK